MTYSWYYSIMCLLSAMVTVRDLIRDYGDMLLAEAKIVQQGDTFTVAWPTEAMQEEALDDLMEALQELFE